MARESSVVFFIYSKLGTFGAIYSPNDEALQGYFNSGEEQGCNKRKFVTIFLAKSRCRV